MTGRQLNIRVGLRVLLFLALFAVPTALMSLGGDEVLSRWLNLLGQLIAAHPLPWLCAIVGGAVLVLAASYFLYDRRRNPLVLTLRDWEKFYHGQDTLKDTVFEKNSHQMLDLPSFRESMLRQSALDARERAEVDRWEEARRKRASVMTRWRMVDLPGYQQWATRYKKLDEIIPNLATYAFPVHPDEFERPFDAKFANEFQGWLNDAADRGRPRSTLAEYKTERRA